MTTCSWGQVFWLGAMGEQAWHSHAPIPLQVEGNVAMADVIACPSGSLYVLLVTHANAADGQVLEVQTDPAAVHFAGEPCFTLTAHVIPFPCSARDAVFVLAHSCTGQGPQVKM